MALDHIEQCRRILAELKPQLGSPRHRAAVAEAIECLARHERIAPPESFDGWRRSFAPSVDFNGKQQQVIRLGLAAGKANRDEIAIIIGSPEQPASNEAVRAFIHRLNGKLNASKAAAYFEPAGRDGNYSTAAIATVITCKTPHDHPAGEVLRLRHR